ncbi:MAG: hypothetical protein GX558_12970 [Clostridiales bacterium]|nr:hypothetical protein [Clostridiales bacterium]
MRKLLFSRESERIQPLRELVEKQKHRTLVAWALDCAPRVLAISESRYPQELRPRQALETAAAWAQGKVKMPVAKRAIHAAHEAATMMEGDAAAQAAARAVGHAAATVHVETHALGLVFYGLTAFVYAAPPQASEEIVAKELQWFIERLAYWEAHIDQIDTPWAAFLMKDNVPNKELLLRQKQPLRKDDWRRQGRGTHSV